MFACQVCKLPYATQREADLCTPASLIAEKYGEASAPRMTTANTHITFRGEPGSAAATGGLIYNRESYFR